MRVKNGNNSLHWEYANIVVPEGFEPFLFVFIKLIQVLQEKGEADLFDILLDRLTLTLENEQEVSNFKFYCQSRCYLFKILDKRGD